MQSKSWISLCAISSHDAFFACQFSSYIVFICYLPRNWNSTQFLLVECLWCLQKMRIKFGMDVGSWSWNLSSITVSQYKELSKSFSYVVYLLFLLWNDMGSKQLYSSVLSSFLPSREIGVKKFWFYIPSGCVMLNLSYCWVYPLCKGYLAKLCRTESLKIRFLYRSYIGFCPKKIMTDRGRSRWRIYW